MSNITEGDAFDETGISEEGLLEGDDVLNVSFSMKSIYIFVHKSYLFDSQQDDELEEETSLLDTSVHEDDILKSPTELKSINLTSNVQSSVQNQSSTAAGNASESVPHKKIVLKRKIVTEITVNENNQSNNNSSAPTETKVAKVDDKSDSETDNDKSVVKLSELTAKERLDLRAKKFGVAPPSDAMKQARAERFGTNKAADENGKKAEGATGKLSTEGTAVSVDVLKKRAERFGASVSTVLTKIENAEKLKKRQERFNISGPTTTTKTTPTPTPTSTPTTATDKEEPKTANEYAEKAKLRAERFKTNA